jgi:DNA-directed RNA polymerase specialized sigma24 family protein
MGESSSEMASRDDAGLISAIAWGDAAAWSQLHERHVAAARRLAGLVADPGQAEDAASGAFARLHAVLRDGAGPRAAVRPYLLTEVRRAAGQDGAANPDADLAGSLLARAFAALPDRERTTLWHAVIEQADPAQTAAILGVTAGDVADLVARASTAYVRSYLKQYESGHDREDCRAAVRGLDHGAAGRLSGPDEFAALPHLRACRECRAAAIELADLGRSLRGWVAPVYLGVAATPGYLSWSRVKVAKQASPAARAAGPSAGGRRRTAETTRRSTVPPPRPAKHAASPAAPAPHRASPARGRLRNASRQQRVLAVGGLVVAAFAATGLGLTMASSNGPAPQPPQRPVPAAIAPPSPAAPAPSSAPAARPSPSSSPSPAPRPSATASPTPPPIATPSPVQDPLPRRHHHHPPL